MKVNPLKKYSSILNAMEIEELISYCDKKSINYGTPFAKYVKWKTRLDKHNILYELKDFITFFENANTTENVGRVVGGLAFYEINYPTLDFVDIYEKCKTASMTQRGSMYDVSNVMNRHGLSREEAQDVVDGRKKMTAGNRENFIRRHGAEKGAELFEEFANKSKTSIDNYKKRYGDEWEKRWNHFLSTRDSSSLEYWIGKLGEEQGRKRFSELQKEFAKSSKLEYWISKLGVEEGTEYHRRLCASKSVTIEDLSRTRTEDEMFLYRASKSLVFLEIKKRTDNEGEALKKYKEYLETRISPVPLQTKGFLVSKSKSCVSKQANDFFTLLQLELGRPLVFGTKANELKIFDEQENKMFFYDCYDDQTNTIIEFNGSAYHADPRVPAEEIAHWCNPWGISWYDVKARDDKKTNCAARKGYNVIVVWDFEVIGKKRSILKILKIKEVLSENQIAKPVV